MNEEKPKYLCVLVLCFLVTQVCIGQTYSSEEENTNETVTLNGTNVSERVFNSFFQTNSVAPSVQGSSVFLTQIGEDNQARVQVAAKASDINIQQNGDYNLTDLEYKVNTVITNLVQNGNSNSIKDYVYNSEEDISLQLQQEGNNLYFERFGSNELTKSLQFRQTEASPTIIIRSFE